MKGILISTVFLLAGSVIGAVIPAGAGIGSSQNEEDYCVAEEITTDVTNVCSDGMSEAALQDDINNLWKPYQRSLGKVDRWYDPTHQDLTASGVVNPIRVAYVVVPVSEWPRLKNTSVKVRVHATGKEIVAKTLECGPAYGELSVGAIMQLGLDSHPQEGQYQGKVTYTFLTKPLSMATMNRSDPVEKRLSKRLSRSLQRTRIDKFGFQGGLIALIEPSCN